MPKFGPSLREDSRMAGFGFLRVQPCMDAIGRAHLSSRHMDILVRMQKGYLNAMDTDK